jgi:hypothetical protein
MARDEVEKIMEALVTLQKEFTEFREEMAPLRDALWFVSTFQRFLKWGGITLFAFVGFVYWLFRRT